MFGLSMWELAIIALVIIFVVGPKRLPDVAKSIGKGYGEFKRTFNEMKQNVSMDDNNLNIRKNNNSQNDGQASQTYSERNRQNSNQYSNDQMNSSSGAPQNKSVEDYAAQYRSQWEEKIIDVDEIKETKAELNNKNSKSNNSGNTDASANNKNDYDSKYLS